VSASRMHRRRGGAPGRGTGRAPGRRQVRATGHRQAAHPLLQRLPPHLLLPLLLHRHARPLLLPRLRHHLALRARAPPRSPRAPPRALPGSTRPSPSPSHSGAGDPSPSRLAQSCGQAPRARTRDAQWPAHGRPAAPQPVARGSGPTSGARAAPCRARACRPRCTGGSWSRSGACPPGTRPARGTAAARPAPACAPACGPPSPGPSGASRCQSSPARPWRRACSAAARLGWGLQTQKSGPLLQFQPAYTPGARAAPLHTQATPASVLQYAPPVRSDLLLHTATAAHELGLPGWAGGGRTLSRSRRCGQRAPVRRATGSPGSGGATRCPGKPSGTLALHSTPNIRSILASERDASSVHTQVRPPASALAGTQGRGAARSAVQLAARAVPRTVMRAARAPGRAPGSAAAPGRPPC